MEKWESAVDRQIREAVEAGVFENLDGKGKRLSLDVNPFEDAMAGTLRRILRDNGASSEINPPT